MSEYETPQRLVFSFDDTDNIDNKTTDSITITTADEAGNPITITYNK